MIRNTALPGGRQAKNEDFQQYVQAFGVFEQMFLALGHDDFIVSGCTITGNNVSSGIIMFGGELTLFDGANGVTFPLRLSKRTRAINPRAFDDGSTKTTAERVEAIQDPVGTFMLSATTPRANNKFLRTVGDALRGNIDGNNRGRNNIYKTLLSDRFESVRIITKAPAANRYLKIGTFPITPNSQAYQLIFSGGGVNRGNLASITINRVNISGTNNATGEVFFSTSEPIANLPQFYIRRNDGESVFEVWTRSPNPSGGITGDILSSIVELIGEAFSVATTSDFVFEETFTWQSSTPSNLVTLTASVIATSNQLNTINTRLGTDASQNISPQSPYSGLINAEVKNGIAFLNGTFVIPDGEDVDPNDLLYNIPAAYRPKTIIHINGYDHEVSVDPLFGMTLGTDGRLISKETDNPVNRVTYYFSVSYPV